jgi:hypothetical protein
MKTRELINLVSQRDKKETLNSEKAKEKKMKTKKVVTGMMAVLLIAGMVFAQEGTVKVPESVIIFKNVKVFDGKSEDLKDVDVLVVKNLIRRIGKDLPASGTYELDLETEKYKEVKVGAAPFDYHAGYTVRVPAEGGGIETKKVPVTVIDGGGRTLMPGLIEGHGHLQMNGNSIADIENNRTWDELAIRSSVMAEAALMLAQPWLGAPPPKGPLFPTRGPMYLI